MMDHSEDGAGRLLAMMDHRKDGAGSVVYVCICLCI